MIARSNLLRVVPALCCSAVFAAQSGGEEHLPRFQDYSVKEVFKGKPARPILTTQRQRNFRTTIREAASKGPNFAGHYTVASWGCGGGCISFALIDASNGSVYDAPFEVLAWGMPSVRYENKYDPSKEDFEPLAYRISSRLLIARGCPEERDTECASYFYEWTGSGFKLLRKAPAVGTSR